MNRAWLAMLCVVVATMWLAAWRDEVPDSVPRAQQLAAADGASARDRWLPNTVPMHARPDARGSLDPRAQRSSSGQALPDAFAVSTAARSAAASAWQQLAADGLADRGPSELLPAQASALIPKDQPGEDPASEAPSDTASGAALDENVAEQRSELEREWHTQRHDPVQSKQMRSYLQETAQALDLPREAIKAADCGSSVCRVRLSFKSFAEASRFEAAAQSPDFRYELKPTTLPAALTAQPTTQAGVPSVAETMDPAQKQALLTAVAAAGGQLPPAPGASAQKPDDRSPPVEIEVLLDYKDLRAR